MSNVSVLENGLRVVTQSIPGSRSVALGVFVAAGSRDERSGEEGLAHLCEHMMFQSTGSRSALEIARQIDGIGGQVNGVTTKDYTCYSATVPGNYSFHALDLFADILLNSVFPEPALDRERQTALNELALNDAEAPRRLHRELRLAAWPGHALGRPVIGTAEALARHSREDLIYFVHRHYTPDRLILAAAGKLEHEDFVAQARDCFWRMLGQSQPAPVRRAEFHEGFRMDPSPRPQCRLAVGMKAPAYGDPERYDFHVLSQIVAGGLSSRLFRRLREELGLVYDVHSDYYAYLEGGMLAIEATTTASGAAPVLECILDTLSNLASGADPVTADELWVAKLRTQGLHELGSQDPHTVMSRLATQEFYFEKQISSEEILGCIDRVSLESLQDSIARYTGAAGPEIAVACLGGEGVRERLEGALVGA